MNSFIKVIIWIVIIAIILLMLYITPKLSMTNRRSRMNKFFKIGGFDQSDDQKQIKEVSKIGRDYMEKLLSVPKYKELIEDLESDKSHDQEHFEEVCKIGIELANKYNKENDNKVDLDIVTYSCLLIDIARNLEDRGEVVDHAIEGARLAEEILQQLNVSKNKIDEIKNCILEHRKSVGKESSSVESEIVREADYLDLLNRVIPRSFASGRSSNKYKRTDYPENIKDFNKKTITKEQSNQSTLHYICYAIYSHPLLQIDSFKHGRYLAKKYRERVDKEIDQMISAQKIKS